MGVGKWLAVHRRTVIAVWLVIVIALAIGARAADTEPQTSFTVPGSQSNAAFTLLEETFPEITDAQVTVVYKATSGTIDDEANDAIIDQAVAALQRITIVGKVTSPTQLPGTLLDVSKDEPIAYSTVVFTEKLSDLPTTLSTKWSPRSHPLATPVSRSTSTDCSSTPRIRPAERCRSTPA